MWILASRHGTLVSLLSPSKWRLHGVAPLPTPVSLFHSSRTKCITSLLKLLHCILATNNITTLCIITILCLILTLPTRAI